MLIQYNPKTFLQLNPYENSKNANFDADSKFVDNGLKNVTGKL
jgi:hypothetical protein